MFSDPARHPVTFPPSFFLRDRESYDVVESGDGRNLVFLQLSFSMAPLSTTTNNKQMSQDDLMKAPKKFTWKELSQLNTPETAHVAVRGKVSCSCK